MTLGEAISSYLGENVVRPFARTLGIYDETPDSKSKVPEWFRPAQDFWRAAVYSAPQTVTDLASSATDLVTGNAGKGQDYTLRGNSASQYHNYGGVAQTVGSFADDIAIALMTSGVGTSLMAGTKMAAAAPTALRIGGRVVAPMANTAQRLVGAAAGAAPTALSSVTELTTGRQNAGEAIANTLMGAAGGTLAAGAWGGGRLANVLSDAAANMGTQAVAGLAPMIPGGQQFDPEAYWKSLAYGAALGTAFGIAGSKPAPDANPTVRFGSKYVEQVPSPPMAAPDVNPATKIITDAETAVYGSSSVPEGASVVDVVTAAPRPFEEVQSIKRNPDGTVTSINDKIAAGDPGILEGAAPEVAAQAAKMERDAYAKALVETTPPEALIPLLDLNILPGSTPDQVAAAINNEWLVQAVNGKGINGVEQMLAQAGLPSPVRVQAQAPEPIFAQEQAPQQMQPTQAPEVQSPFAVPLEQAARAVNAQEPVAGYIDAPVAPEQPFAFPLEQAAQAVDGAQGVAGYIDSPAPVQTPLTGFDGAPVTPQRILSGIAPEGAQAPLTGLGAGVMARGQSKVVQKVTDNISELLEGWNRRAATPGMRADDANVRAQAERMRQLFSSDGVPVRVEGKGATDPVIKMIAEIDGSTPGEVRRSIKNGVSVFGDGAVAINKDLETGKYVARFFGDGEDVASTLYGRMPSNEGLKAEHTATVVEFKRAERSKRALEEAYADIADVIEEAEGGDMVAKSELMMRDKDGNSTTQVFKADKEYEEWKQKVATTQKSLASKLLAHLGGAGKVVDSEGNPVTETHIKYWLMADQGPAGWREAGERLMEASVPQPTIDFMRKEIGQFGGGTGNGKPPIRSSSIASGYSELMEVNSYVPEEQVARNIARRIGNIADAGEKAAALADVVGVTPDDIIDFVRYEKAAQNRKAKIMSATDADDLRPLIQTAVETNPELSAALENIEKYLTTKEGGDEWNAVLNRNLLGQGEGYNWNLRQAATLKTLFSAPGIRSVAYGSGLYALDSVVSDLKDDETYFGIPGSVVKNLLGDGSLSYAAIGAMPFMRGKLKGAAKVGTKWGTIETTMSLRQRVRNRIGEWAADSSDLGYGLDNISIAQLPLEAQMRAFDMFAEAGNVTDSAGVPIAKGTPEYEARAQEFLHAHNSSHVKGAQILGTGGTLGKVASKFVDLNLMRAKVPFVEEHIGRPIDQLEVQDRRGSTKMKEFFDGVYVPIAKFNRKSDARIPDAIAELDYRMSELGSAKEKLDPVAYKSAQDAIHKDVEARYFTKDGVLDKVAISQYKDVQGAMNSLRDVHLRALVGLQEGVPYWELQGKRLALEADKNRLLEGNGAAAAGLEKVTKDLADLDARYAALKEEGGKALADERMPNYKAERKDIHDSARNYTQLIKGVESQLATIQKSLDNIDGLDAAVQNSIDSGYILRHRDKYAPLVLRLYYDPELNIAGVRREYTSHKDLAVAKEDYAVKALTEQEHKRVLKYSNELDKVEAKLAQSPDDLKLLAEEERLNKAILEVQQRTPADKLTSAELNARLSQEKIVIDTYKNTSKKVKAGAAAAKVLMNAMAGADSFRGVMAARANAEQFLESKFVKTDDAYGNQNLRGESAAKNGVVMAEEKITLDGLVDAIDDGVDGTVDRAQLKDVLEKYVFYSEKVKQGGRVVENIWIDNIALRNVIQRFIEPSIPNLAKRNNIGGYYNPDGKWTTQQKWDYLTKSAEIMQQHVSNYSLKVGKRKVFEDALNYLNKHGVDNGVREWVEDLAGGNSVYVEENRRWMKAAYAVRRGYSMATLAANLTAATANRIYGIDAAISHAGMNLVTKYGVTQVLPDGTKTKVDFKDTLAEARKFIADKQEAGEVGWSIEPGVSYRNVNLRNSFTFAASMFAPRSTLRLLAAHDPYWKAIRDQAEKLNLQEGSILGNYAMQQGISKGTAMEKGANAAARLLTMVERTNNWNSILLSGVTTRAKLGLTSEDFAMMNKGQISEAVEMAIAPVRDKVKKGLKTPQEALLDALAENMVFDRGFEQGRWGKHDQTYIERKLSENPLGVIGLTMSTPVFRAASAKAAMFREARRTHGSLPQQFARYAPAVAGSSIVMALMGIAATPLAVAPWFFAADVAKLSESLWDIFAENDETKLKNVSGRQMWEELGGYVGENIGLGKEFGRDFVRAFYSEGLIKHTSDMMVGNDGGLADAVRLPGAQIWWSTGERAVRTLKGYENTSNLFESMYNTTNFLPTSFKRVVQAGVQSPLWKGQKLDRIGQPIIDEFSNEIGAVKAFGWGDVIKYMAAGKKWSEVRSGLIEMEGGTPLRTPEDRVRWVNKLVGQPGVKFGSGISSRTPGTKETTSAGVFERDAPALQDAIARTYEDRYRSRVEQGKQWFAKMVNENPSFNGMTLERAMAVASTGDNKTEQDVSVRGKGVAGERERFIKQIEQWGRSRAIIDAVNEYYGKPVGAINDKYMASTDDPGQYAVWKFYDRFSNAQAAGTYRRQGRGTYNGYQSP